MSGIVSAEQLNIYSITISSERFLEDKRLIVSGEVNGSGVGVELVVFENISLPYLTGSIIIQDDNDIFRVADIRGTERVEVILGSPESPAQLKKQFIIASTERSVKVNDQLSTLEFELIEAHGYFDRLSLINKVYNGTYDKMISKILTDNTNMSIRSNYFIQPTSSIRYIVPNISPLSAIDVLLNYLTTKDGLPYFLFSSLNTEDLVLTDLESTLQRDPFNRAFNKSFTFSRASINRTSSNELLDQAFNISSLEAYDNTDTLSMATQGALGVNLDTVNSSTGIPINNHINMLNEYQYLISGQVLPEDQAKIPIDMKFRESPEGKFNKPLTDYNSKQLSVVSNSPYDDQMGLISNYTNIRNVVVKNAYLKHLNDNAFNISVPGLVFGVKNINRAVGHQIDINIFREGISDESGKRNLDERKSGAYVMLAKKHVFDITNFTHNVTIRVGRVAEPRRAS